MLQALVGPGTSSFSGEKRKKEKEFTEILLYSK